MITKKEAKVLHFALSYLRANQDDAECFLVEADDPVGETVEPIDWDKLEECLRVMTNDAVLSVEAKIDLWLDAIELDPVDTIAEVVEAGADCLDGICDLPTALFKADGQWWVGTVEFTIAVAATEYVRLLLIEHIAMLDEDDAPSAIWQEELAKLPPESEGRHGQEE